MFSWGVFSSVSKLILTASGGPFLNLEEKLFTKITVEKALKHPNWSMGSKITIDSATLMNKGLELIEAHWLFNKPINDIDVVIHPESIIHSLVEFNDGFKGSNGAANNDYTYFICIFLTLKELITQRRCSH